jgi:hypothetical protein
MERWRIMYGEREVAAIEAVSVRWIPKGVDFQPNLFNGYHAVELGDGAPLAVLNLPQGMSIERAA